MPPQPRRTSLRNPTLLLSAGLTIAACLTSHGGYEGPTPDGGPLPDAASFDAATSDGGQADAGGSDLASGPKDLAMAPDLSTRPDDPFDPASCSTPALSSAQALTLLGAVARLKLADATLYRRTRTCTGMTPATCGPWGKPVVHDQLLLTYSGGVVTDYKSFTFSTHIILFPQAGQPKFTIRHESDYRHDATKDSRGVQFSFGADPMVNTYPIIYVWDFFPKPDRYDDLQGLLGDDGYLHAAEHCARLSFVKGIDTEIAALYRY